MPRVSVIVAARDAAGTLADALASVHAQTFDDWELIVVDDGSLDATADVAAEHGARVLRHEQPQGPAASRNRAAAEASGDLLAVLDADDEWLPDFLAVQIAALNDDPSAGLVTCDAYLCTPDGTRLEGTYAEREGAPDPMTLSALLEAHTVFGLVVMRRGVFVKLGGYAQDMVHAEDYDLWLRFAESGHGIKRTHRPLAVYRLNPLGLTADRARASAGMREAYRRSLRRGALTRSQRRLARRQRRLHSLVVRRVQAGRGQRLALLPWSVVIALEHPERWRHWLHRPWSIGRARDRARV